MKLGMLLTPIVALTAAGWLGMEGYYMATGACPLSGCSEDAAVGAQPATLSAEGAIGAQPATSGGDACCPPTLPALTVAATTGSSMTDGAMSPGAVAPNAPTCGPTDACCPATPMAAIGTTTPAPSDATIPMTPKTPNAHGDCGPNDVCGSHDDVCGPDGCKAAPAAATGLETPAAAMDCGPMDCDEQGGGCCGESATAPVDTQSPTAPAAPRN